MWRASASRAGIKLPCWPSGKGLRWRISCSELTDNPKNGYQVVGVGISGYGPPRGEHLVVNDREIPILGGETYALQAIRNCGADTVAIAGTEHFGSRESAGLSGSSSRWALNLWCRLESWMWRSLGW